MPTRGTTPAQARAFLALNPDFARPVTASPAKQWGRVRGHEQVELLSPRVTGAWFEENARLSQHRIHAVVRRGVQARVQARQQRLAERAEQQRTQQVAARTRQRLASAREQPAAGERHVRRERKEDAHEPDHPTTRRHGRSAWWVGVGIDDGREPWADTLDADEFPTCAAAQQWAERTIRSRRALERLDHTQGMDGNEPLLVAALEQVYYRPVAYDHPTYGPLVDTDREVVDGTQATAYLHADRTTVTWEEPERGQGGGAGER